MLNKSRLVTIGLTMAALAVVNSVKALSPAKNVIGLGGKGLI